jgi:hypothetical protein
MEKIVIELPVVSLKVSEFSLIKQVAEYVPWYMVGIPRHEDELGQIPNRSYDEDGKFIPNSPNLVNCIRLQDFIKFIQTGNLNIWNLKRDIFIPLERIHVQDVEPCTEGYVQGHLFQVEFMSEENLVERKIREVQQSIETAETKLRELKTKLDVLVMKGAEL